MGCTVKQGLLSALVLGCVMTANSALAKDDLTVAMQLEPPHLDPTSAAAQAIDSVLYANIFQGLTRFMGDGSIVPALAERRATSSRVRLCRTTVMLRA